jgi:hypothetical protein
MKLEKMHATAEQAATTHADLISDPDDIQVIQDGVLQADLPDGFAQAVITSPPYGVESLSYLRTHLLSFRVLRSVLGRDPYERDDRVIGSEYLGDVDGTDAYVRSSPSPTLRAFFASIGNDTSNSQRRAMMLKFFEDVDQVAARLHRWIRPGGWCGWVIGNKRLGETIIPTHEITAELFEAAGFRLAGSIAHKLKWNNSNSEVPWQERTIQQEWVLLFKKSR